MTTLNPWKLFGSIVEDGFYRVLFTSEISSPLFIHFGLTASLSVLWGLAGWRLPLVVSETLSRLLFAGHFSRFRADVVKPTRLTIDVDNAGATLSTCLHKYDDVL